MIQNNTPSVTNADGQSNLVAAHNPTFITYNRIDDTFTCQPNGGFFELTYAGPNTGTVTGDHVYIDITFAFDGTRLKGLYRVLSNSGTYLILDLPWASSGTADIGNVWYESQYSNYHLIVQSYTVDDSGLIFTPLLSERIYMVDHVAVFDISRHKKMAVNMDDAHSHLTQQHADNNISARLRIEVSEVHDFIGTIIPDTAIQYLVVNAAMQIPHIVKYPSSIVNYKDNMIDYLTRDSYTIAPLPKWLHPSSKARYWNGLPFDLGFFLSLALLSDGIKSLERYYTSTGAVTGSSVFTDLDADSSTVQRVNRIDLVESSYAEDISLIKLDIVNAVSGSSILQQMEVRVMCAPKNPVYLKATPVTGPPVYWCFDKFQIVSMENSNGTFTSRPNPEMLATIGSRQLINKSSTKIMSMGAEMLDDFDLPIIEAILTSTNVQMLMNPETWLDEYPIWESVRVKPNSTISYNTKHSQHSVSLTIELNETILQTN